MQLPYKLRDIVRQCMAAFSRNDYVEDLDQRLIAPLRESGGSDTAAVILDAIRNAIRSSREAELFEAFLCGNEALAEFAAGEGSSVGKLRREIEAIFSRVAVKLAGEGRATRAPRLLHCRQALQDMVPAQKCTGTSLNERLVPSRRRRFMLGMK